MNAPATIGSVEEVRRVAEGLTKAHADALRMWAPCDERIMGGYGLQYVHAHLVEQAGVKHPIFGAHYRLTRLGIAVRNHLLASERGS